LIIVLTFIMHCGTIEGMRGGKRIGSGRKVSKDKKVSVTIRIDADIVAWLRSQDNYNKLVNALIREKIESSNGKVEE